jgi:acetyl esterase/lipase
MKGRIMGSILKWTLLGAVAVLSTPATVPAQGTDALAGAVHISTSYRVAANVTYLKVGDVEDQLDVYQLRTATGPTPTLVFIHGGNWVGGSRTSTSLMLLPFLEMGWNVVNIDYRLLHVAPAPAAADDCYCALRWISEHAKDYNIDTSRIVVSGNSAGGHLALLVAMAPASVGLGSPCRGGSDLHPAAVINWYGFSDLVDLLDGPNTRPAVQAWIGDGSNQLPLARRLSPMSYVQKTTPPILTIQGDADPVSPYQYTVQFHQALTKAGAPNQLVTVPGGKHGGFSDPETREIYRSIQTFLHDHVLNEH